MNFSGDLSDRNSCAVVFVTFLRLANELAGASTNVSTPTKILHNEIAGDRYLIYDKHSFVNITLVVKTQMVNVRKKIRDCTQLKNVKNKYCSK